MKTVLLTAMFLAATVILTLTGHNDASPVVFMAGAGIIALSLVVERKR